MTGTSLLSGALGRVSGVYPVLFAALVLECVLVTHGRQFTDGPRRGVSVEVRAIGDDLGRLVGKELGDHVHALEPDRTRKMRLVVGRFREYLEQHEIVATVDLRFKLFALYGLHDAPPYSCEAS